MRGIDQALVDEVWREIASHPPGRVEAVDPDGVLDRAADPAHPALVTHVLSVFYGDGAGAADHDDAVHASLFLPLRTLTAALDLGAVEA